jgi:hypothetical protein
MAGITLDNTPSGSVDITLDWITSYTIVNRRKYATKQVPGKVTPTVDTDTFVFYPKQYRFSARISNAEKATLQTLANEADYRVVLDDNETVNNNCRLEDVSFNSIAGDTEYPWVATISLIGEDH